MDLNYFSGAYFAIENNIKLPKKLQEFLSIDGMGMEGFELMLKNPELARRIPKDVRIEYEVIYSELSLAISNNISELRKQLDDFENNPQIPIHQIIANSYRNNK